MSKLDKVEATGKTVLTGLAALAASVKVHVNDEHEEVDRVELVGMPVFKRDAQGRPKVLGVTFPRWIRGPRK